MGRLARFLHNRTVHGSEPARRPAPGIYYGWVVAVVLGVTELVSWGILYYAFSILLAPMERELGWARAESSGAFSVGLLVSGAVAVPIGRFLDRHGGRLVMSLGSAAGVALLLAWANVHDLTSLYLVWAGMGVVLAATLYEPAFAVVMQWFRRRRVRALTVVTVFGGLASTAFYPITAWLVEAQGWRAALVTLAVVLGLITVPLHVLTLRASPSPTVPHPDGYPPAHPRGQARHGGGKASFLQMLGQAPFRWLVLAIGLNQLASVGAVVHLVPALGERGLEPAFAATLGGLVGVMQVAGRLLYGPFGDRLPVLRSMALIHLVEPLGLLALLSIPGVPGVLVFVALFGAGRGTTSLTRPAVVVHLYGPDRFASVNGFLALVTAVSRALGPVSVGLARDWFGGYDPALLTLVAIGFASAACLIMIKESGDIPPAASPSGAV